MTLWLDNGMHTLLIIVESLSIMPRYGQWFSDYALKAFGHHIETFGMPIMPRYGQWFGGYALRVFGHHFDGNFCHFGWDFAPCTKETLTYFF